MLRTVHFFVQGSTGCRPLWNNSSHVPWQLRICLRRRGREKVSKKEMMGIDKSEGPGEKTVTLHQHFILSLSRITLPFILELEHISSQMLFDYAHLNVLCGLCTGLHNTEEILYFLADTVQFWSLFCHWRPFWQFHRRPKLAIFV